MNTQAKTVDQSNLIMPEKNSLAESLASGSASQEKKILDNCTDRDIEGFLYDWKFWARPKQIAPPGDWGIWLLKAGRGFGKTFSGAGWLHSRAMDQPGRWCAMVARIPRDARDYMIEGPGGILRNTHPSQRPVYTPSKSRLTWPNGSYATIYSDADPDAIRGFSGDTAWLDEFAKYRNPQQTWDNLSFGMREASNDRPRRCITSTPRPIKILKTIQERKDCVTVIGSSYENRSNLDPTWFDELREQYEGTRLGRQEIWAETLEDVEGALWTLHLIDEHRVKDVPEELVRVVVAIDPAVTATKDSNETGIIVCGIGVSGDGYVLEDCSGRHTPRQWAVKAVAAYERWNADRIIGEANNGGDMIEYTIRTVDQNVSYKKVHASRGKQTRAEPVAALDEKGKIHHVGAFPELEDQLCNWVPGEASPDRLDARVWGFTELMVHRRIARQVKIKGVYARTI